MVESWEVVWFTGNGGEGQPSTPAENGAKSGATTLSWLWNSPKVEL